MSRCLQYDNFLIDCDGVLWKQDNPIPGEMKVRRVLRKRNTEMKGKTNDIPSEHGTKINLKLSQLIYIPTLSHQYPTISYHTLVNILM